MKDTILENLVRPLFARVGTALAAIILTYGFESHVVEPFVNAVIGVLLLGVDLLLSRYYRKLAFWNAVEKKGFGPVVGYEVDGFRYVGLTGDYSQRPKTWAEREADLNADREA